ncbi:MAG: hypothetical protein AB8B79_21710 [Granulosicoccus sp.]
MGTGYGHIAVEVDDIYKLEEALQAHSVEVIRAAGPMMAAGFQFCIGIVHFFDASMIARCTTMKADFLVGKT